MTRKDLTYRSERVFVAPSAPLDAPLKKDWTIQVVGLVDLIHEDLIAEAYADDRRKAGRKIRQQRRRLRRVNAQYSLGPGEGVPAQLLRAKVVLR